MCPPERLLYLLQVVELHGYLSEEEVDVRSPLHGVDEIRLYIERGRERRRRRGGGEGFMKYEWNVRKLHHSHDTEGT